MRRFCPTASSFASKCFGHKPVSETQAVPGMVHENYRATALDRVAALFRKVSKCFEVFINSSDIGTICILELCIKVKA
jgi:hypothetical protein